MRGGAGDQVVMLSTLAAEEVVPQDNPIRQIKPISEKGADDGNATNASEYQWPS